MGAFLQRIPGVVLATLLIASGSALSQTSSNGPAPPTNLIVRDHPFDQTGDLSGKADEDQGVGDVEDGVEERKRGSDVKATCVPVPQYLTWDDPIRRMEKRLERNESQYDA